ncbi:stage V sporulation protein K [Salipaludibacillus neizhouensis]|uniref:Stage V sporulation protein K n=1 Tax=Salipaludibacillus neizhouensis TaxID=885475 RepID=A0A3A9KF32_9BACI|nr:AAA family ATPase [Salipaludibacillus neizhouensis]RKL69171.1 stage V sporulation protein K [Salipaludibacillus neizhouensis]
MEKQKKEASQDSIQKMTELKNRPFNQLKESELVRLFKKIEDNEDASYTTEAMSEWRAMIAVARYERKKEWDTRVDHWISDAVQQSPDSDYIAEIVIYLGLTAMNEPWFKEDFPKIRETDHSQGKKKAVDTFLLMLQQGKAWQQELTAKKEVLQQSLTNRVDKEQAKLLEDGIILVDEIGNDIDRLLLSAKEYRESVSGIYSSKEKKRIMDEDLATLLYNVGLWESWRESQENSDSTPLDELNAMIGMEEVKEKVHSYYYFLEYQRIREQEGYHFENGQSLNMILTGNPGTGKTSIARLLAKIYYQLGALPREEVVEVDRSSLVGGYVGQTEEKTLEVIESARGGILFIDEAYSLKRDGASGNDYGQTAIDTIVSAMTSGSYAGKFAVILAGYPEEMRTFLWSNPGLRSRFPETNHIHLPDFSMNELLEIGEQVALENDYSLTEDALTELENRLKKEQVDESFGNARTVKDIILSAIFKQGAEIAKEKNYSKESFTILDKEAFALLVQKEKKHDISGEEKLERLIGLQNVKEQVTQLSSFVKVQKERAEIGLPLIPIQLHAIFTGPPGTGKTTLASIYSQILYELELLKRGHVVQVGRSDLVAGFVGQTAIKTKKKIREALGGVLFIDEAYSLLSKGAQDFGAEAIDTLVEEMTKHEENLVVIFAGYSDQMERLLQSNPGLSSRFKKTIVFPNYSAEELLKIVQFYVDEYGYELEEGVEDFIYQANLADPPAGNARSMKDYVEHAIQRQAYRVVNEQDNQNSLTMLKKNDFSIISNQEDQ